MKQFQTSALPRPWRARWKYVLEKGPDMEPQMWSWGSAASFFKFGGGTQQKDFKTCKKDMIVYSRTFGPFDPP